MTVTTMPSVPTPRQDSPVDVQTTTSAMVSPAQRNCEDGFMLVGDDDCEGTEKPYI